MEDIENLKIEVEQLKEENEHLKAIKNIDDVLLALREKKQPSDGDSHMRQLLKNQIATMKAIDCLLRSDYAGQEMRGCVKATLKILGDVDV